MIKVWDPVIRTLHWLLAATVFADQFFIDGGDESHKIIGYFACALIAVRILWGFIGTRYARFSDIKSTWPKKSEFLTHLKIYLKGKHQRQHQHYPLAVIGMSAMLICVVALGVTGWMLGTDHFFGDSNLEEIHHWIANALMVLVVIHVTGVIRESLIHKENLIASMIHGKKKI